MTRILALIREHWKNLLIKIGSVDDQGFPWIVEPIFLLGLALLAYGLFAPQLGYYWDNWGFSWMREFRDSLYLINSFGALRPLQGYFEATLTPILGINSTAWQVFSILTRWLSAVTFWLVLKTYWPENRRMNFVAAMFFLIYPGFIQQPIAQGYPYVWVFMSLFFISLVLLFRLVQGSRRPILIWVVTLILSLLTLFSIEYLFGLELTRLAFVWFALGYQGLGFKKRFLRTLKFYLPFLVTLAIYLFWRLAIFSQSFYQPVLLGDLHQAPGRTVVSLGQTILQTITTVSFGAWSKVFQMPSAHAFSTKLWLIYIISLVGVFLTVFFFLSRSSRRLMDDYRQPWQWILLGLFSCLLAGIPYFVADLHVALSFPEDHYTLPFIFGVSLLLSGIIALLSRRFPVTGLVAVVVALAAGYQIHNGYLYRQETRVLQNFIWQLNWRAPGVEPGTVFVTEDMEVFPFDDDEAVGYAINWAYHPAGNNGQLDYGYMFASARLGNAIPSFTSGQTVRNTFQTDKFVSTTDKIVVMEYAPPSCLHILSPIYDTDRVSLKLDPLESWRREKNHITLLPALLQDALPLSNLDQIIADPLISQQPPEFLFGTEPVHQWCYFYERADLARQIGDWNEVNRIADEVFTIPYYPDDYYEYLLFIDGYIQAGRWDDARQLTAEVADTGPVLLPSLCRLWLDAERSLRDNEQTQLMVRTVIDDLGLCQLP